MVAHIRLAYYCSGHGYGHATRVSAFASALLSVQEDVEIHIISSAPTHVFSECIGHGAHYRYADIDPIIAQPLAYRVDRQKSVQVLQTFLSEKDDKLAIEVAWLASERIDCVLSDAAFLACEAATKACIPSILITNFTFDSVYSYLSSEIMDCGVEPPSSSLQVPDLASAVCHVNDDIPISPDLLEPLVAQLLAGYRHADVLLLLPGFIPIPSFLPTPSLPAPGWIDPATNRFRSEIESNLLGFPVSGLLPSIPFPSGAQSIRTENPKYNTSRCTKPPRTIKYAPLLVRSSSPNINTQEGRKKLLTSIGIPEIFHDSNQTQILLVSFGGQTIRRPQSGKSPSRSLSPFPEGIKTDAPNFPHEYNHTSPFRAASADPRAENNADPLPQDNIRRPTRTFSRKGSTKIFIPGAPAPAINPASPHSPTFSSLPLSVPLYSPAGVQSPELSAGASLDNPTFTFAAAQEEEEPSLLPSPSWIAIICGVPSNWSISGEEEEDLPPGFYIAPRDVYMPDLTAIADVLLGKLGYGTVSESVAQSTPFVYVPRPLFVEEHGLRLLLEAEGTGVELSRHEYESGHWAKKVDEAYQKGKKTKRTVKDIVTTEQDVRDLANWVLGSVRSWQCANDV
ncbi:hypothetical protein K439DRAFT_1417894 [Ramaria rubella]|nr:hypothetical protein K439DRAFT_1417894 [Ramaria rubella]